MGHAKERGFGLRVGDFLNMSASAPVAAGYIDQADAFGRVQHPTRQHALTLIRMLEASLVIAVVFLNGADFRGGSGEEFTVHWQIYLRLLVSGLAGIYGLLRLPATFRDFLAWPGVLVAAYVTWYAVSVVTSIDRLYSAAAWLSLAGVVLMIPAAMRSLGGYRFLLAVACGLTLYVLGSWIAFVFFPEVGVYEEQVTESAVYSRMSGLGHPNELGFYAAYLALTFAGLGMSRRLSWWIAGAAMGLAAITLLGCFSRTAIIGCVAGLVIMFHSRARRMENLSWILIIVALALGAIFVSSGQGNLDWALENGLRQLTKSGSTEELTTGTGRTEIWKYGISKISESPNLGYGYCSTRFIMQDYSYHCHNMVLNALMHGGFISGLVVTTMILYLLHSVIASSYPPLDGLAAMVLIGGMVDGILGAPAPAASSLIWFMLLFWRQQGLLVELKVELNTPR